MLATKKETISIPEAIKWLLLETASVAPHSKYGQQVHDTMNKHLDNIEKAHCISIVHQRELKDDSIEDFSLNNPVKYIATLNNVTDEMFENGFRVKDSFIITHVDGAKVYVKSLDGFACWLDVNRLSIKQLKESDTITKQATLLDRKREFILSNFRNNLKSGDTVKFRHKGITNTEVIYSCTDKYVHLRFWSLKISDVYPEDWKFPMVEVK